MTSIPPPGADDPLVVGAASIDSLDERGLAALEQEQPQAAPPPTQTALRRFAHDRVAMGALAFLLLLIAAAILAPWIAPYNPNAQDLLHIDVGPSGAHWLGTDDLGRDILSRLIWGARPPLRAAFQIVGIALVLSLPIAMIAGFFRGWIDSTTMRFMDALFSFPPLVLALTVAALLGPNLNDASIAIAIVFIPSFVRLIRGEVISVREEVYVEASRSIGAAPGRLIRRHILPNVASPLIIQLALSLGYALLIDAGLSFLGVGEQPPTASWGTMLTEAYRFIFQAPWTLVFPGLAILVTVLSFNLVADGLRDALGRERYGTKKLAKAAAVGAEQETARSAVLAPAVPATPAAANGARSAPLLEVEHLRVEFAVRDGWLPVVEDVGFSVRAGETVGLVGESGSGKTVSALAVMGLLPRRESRVSEGSVRFGGQELTTLEAARMRQVRGNQISMIFQEPMTSLNPAFTVGNQIAEQVRVHRGGSRSAAAASAVEMLDRVGIPDPGRRAKDYPYAFSGGMRQRVMIAMALSCEPQLLIADEPTTALDVTTQAQILDLLTSLQREHDMAMVFVTHDLGVIADVADRIVVMYAGQVVERTVVAELFERPRHPYTEALLASMPQLTPPGSPLTVIPGQVPRPDELPFGCRFAARCHYALDRCAATPVPLAAVPPVALPPRSVPRTGPEPDGDGGAELLSRCRREGELVLAGATGLAHPTPAGPTPAGPTSAGPTSEGPTEGGATAGEWLLEVRGLGKDFPVRSGPLRRVSGSVSAVDAVDLRVQAGTTVGLVGESGSGKSTLARLILRLLPASRGTVELGGVDITDLDGRQLRQNRQSMQIVFQDPYSSLDPRMRVAEIVGEPLEIHQGLTGQERDRRVAELLEQVGLARYALQRRPHEFSGGQRQRIAIARALALRPRLLVCDEPVSALDVSTQSQVINLLTDLQDELGLAYLFIAHDLSVVRHISDRIAVMYLGRIVEEGPAEEVYGRPTHPYTAALLSAIPVPEVRRAPGGTSPTVGPGAVRGGRSLLTGEVANPLEPPSGCRFHPRCPMAMDICTTVQPEPFAAPGGTTVACHLHTSGPVLAGATVASLVGGPARPT